MKRTIREAVERFFAEERLPIVGYPEIEISTREEAGDLCLLLQEKLSYPEQAAKLLRAFQPDEPTEEVIDFLRSEGTPVLLELEPKLAEGANAGLGDDRLFLLKLLAIYGTAEGADRIVAVSKAGYAPEAYLWSVIFGCFTREHPESQRVFAELGCSLPRGFAAVALLDAANQCAIGGMDFRHPFDSEQGVKALRQWLRNSEPEHFSYAHSATAALPFISKPLRDELLQLAMDHPDPDVSVEAAWAAAKIGMERGIRELARYASNVKTSAAAVRYLHELDREDAIPADAQRPEFQAMAEMVNWLSHPNEFGEPPTNITLYDTRELFWPPTDDRRRVWLFRYEYPKSEHRAEDDIGLGMTGSTTFALFGETTAELAPLEAYALHCCWELEANRDSRAPKKRTIAVGLRILAEYNDLPEITESQMSPPPDAEAGLQGDVPESGNAMANFISAMLEKAKQKRSEGDSRKKALRGAVREVMAGQFEKLKEQVQQFRAHLVAQRKSAPLLCTATRTAPTDVLQRPEVGRQRAALESAGYQLEGVYQFEKVAGFSLALFAHPENGTVATISCSKEVTTELAADYPDGRRFCLRDTAPKRGLTPPPWITYRHGPGLSVPELVAIFESSRPPGHKRKSGAEAAGELAADFRRTQSWRLERAGWNRDEVQAQLGITDPVLQEEQLSESCLKVREKWLYAWFKENDPRLADSLLEAVIIVHDELDGSVLFFLWIMAGGRPDISLEEFQSGSPRDTFRKLNEAQGSPLKLIAQKVAGYPADFYAGELSLALSIDTKD